jgi:hypothetical protein
MKGDLNCISVLGIEKYQRKHVSVIKKIWRKGNQRQSMDDKKYIEKLRT